MHVYISDKLYFYILNIFLYNLNYIYINIEKYMYICVYLFINNKYTQNTHTYIMQTKTFILDEINRD